MWEVNSARTLAESDRQRGYTTQPEVGPPGWFFRFQAQEGEATQHCAKGDLAFDPCQRSAEAEVCSISEGQMPVVFACDIEPVGIRETLGVAVGRSHDCYDRLALADKFAAQFAVVRSHARSMLAGALVAQHLFHRRRNKGYILA